MGWRHSNNSFSCSNKSVAENSLPLLFVSRLVAQNPCYISEQPLVCWS